MMQSTQAPECPNCGGHMIRGRHPYHLFRRGYHLIFDAVPGWVCTQCGEGIWEEVVVGIIENALDALDEAADRLQVVEREQQREPEPAP
jgi:YgiT-type zinc finger domain-containing protein